MAKHNVGRTILSLVLEFQNLNRFISLDPSWALSLASSHAFVEIDAQEGTDIGTLASILEMPRTSVATIVECLAERGIVSSRVSKIDRRQRALSLTKKGRTLMRNIDSVVEPHLVWLLSPLQRDEQARLQALFRDIANGLGAPDSRPRAHEHDIRKELRRVTRALRLIHADFMGSKVESPEWQFLAKVVEQRRYDTVSELAMTLQLPLSTATTIAYRLRSRGFISFGRSDIDRRAASFEITRKGRAFFEDVESRMVAKIAAGVSSLDSKELSERLALLKRVVTGRRAPGAGAAL